MRKKNFYSSHFMVPFVIAVCGFMVLMTSVKAVGNDYEDACECWDGEGCACSEDYNPPGDYTFAELYACETVPQCSLIVCNPAYVCSLFNEGVTYEELISCVGEIVDLSQSGIPAEYYLAFALQQCDFSIEELLAAGVPPCLLMMDLLTQSVSCELLDYVEAEEIISCFMELFEALSAEITIPLPFPIELLRTIFMCKLFESCDIPMADLGGGICDLVLCGMMGAFGGGTFTLDPCSLFYLDVTYEDLMACGDAMADIFAAMGTDPTGDIDPAFAFLQMLLQQCTDVPLNVLLDFGIPPCLLGFSGAATPCSLYDKGITLDDYMGCFEEMIPVFGDSLIDQNLALAGLQYPCALLTEGCVTLDSLLEDGVPPCHLWFCGISPCSTYRAGVGAGEILQCFEDLYTGELLELMGTIIGDTIEIDTETMLALMSCNLYLECDVPLDELLEKSPACSLLKCGVPVCSLIKAGEDIGELLLCEVHACSIYQCDPTTLCDLISEDVSVTDLLACGAPACSIYKCDPTTLCDLISANVPVSELLKCPNPPDPCDIYDCDPTKLCDLISANVPVSELLKCPNPLDPCDIYACDPTTLCDLLSEGVPVKDLLNCGASACDIYTCDPKTLPALITEGQACDLYSVPCEVPLCDLIDAGAQPAELLACLGSPCELCDCDVPDVCPHLTPGEDCDADFGTNGDECNWGTGPCVFDDRDDDTVSDFVDNCPDTYNPGQEDGDTDGVGDVCDNCPEAYNPGQEDFNNDGIGNHCQDSDDDGVLDSDEGDGDRDGDGIPDYADYDPSGYFYDEFSGEIITGGRVEVSGLGTITILHNGSSGYYQFLLDPPPGGAEYTLALTLPPSMSLSADCLPQPGPYDPSGQPNPVVLGHSEVGNTGVLSSNACTDYYLSFYLEDGDPEIFNNNFPLRRLPAVGWGDTCMDHNLNEPAEDYLVGSGSGYADQDTYAVGFYNPKGEARLTSIFFQWYDPGSVNLWVFTSRGGFCPTCEPLLPGQSPLGVFLGEVGAGDFTGNWEWEEVDLGDGPCLQIPAKSCFFIVWSMKEGESRPRMLGDAGHSGSHSWIYNGQQGAWKCFPGYEYMVKVCLDYEPGCVEIHEPDITWSHPYRDLYPCEGDQYDVQAVFKNRCDEDVSFDVWFYEFPWGLFNEPGATVRAFCNHNLTVPANSTERVTCDCRFDHASDTQNWWARNITVGWTRDVWFCSDRVDEVQYTRRCRMTVWPDGPWDKNPVKWGLAPITIPVHNEHADPMRFKLRVTDVPENWRADLSWTDRTLSPGATENVILTVWPGGEVEPDTATVITVRAFKCNGEWGYVEIEFLPYPEHFYLGPDGRPVQPVHVEDIRWSPVYPCHNTAYDVSVTVVNDGPNSAYPKISFGLAPWGFFTPVSCWEKDVNEYSHVECAVYDTVLWGGIGGKGRQVVAPYHYRTPWFKYEDLECTYYQQYARNIVIDYPVVRRHCLTPGEEFGTWSWTAEDSTTEYLRDCERWLWSKHRWVDGDSTWMPVTIPIPVYNEEPYFDHIELWIDANVFPPHIPDGWEYAFDETDFWLEPGEAAEANLTIVPVGQTPPSSMPAHVVVHAAKGYCDTDTDVVEIKFMPFTGMCIRDTSGLKVAYRYSETCGGFDPTVVPGDRVDIGLMLDNEAPVSAVQIELGYEGDYMRVVDVATTVRTSGFELVHRQLAPGLHEIALYSTPSHPRILPNDPGAHCALPPRYYHEGLLSIVTVTFEILAGAPAGRCADIWYNSVILDGLPDWEGHPKEPLCLKYQDKGQICFGGYLVPAKCDVTGSYGVPDTMVTLMDLFDMLYHIVGERSLGSLEGVFDPTTLIWAADANGDGLINIIDLMKCINRAVGVCDPKAAVADVAVGDVVGVSGRTVVVPVSVSSEVDVAGVVLRFRYDGDVLVAGEPELTDRSVGMTAISRVIGDELVVFVSGAGAGVIGAGAGSVVRVPFTVAGEVEDVRIEVGEPIVFTVDEGISFGYSSVLLVKSSDFAPTEYSLTQNYPNPFNPVTTIEYALPEPARVKLEIFNLLGQVVGVLVDSDQEAGYHKVSWDAKERASGMYFYRIQANDYESTRRMVLMK